MTTVPDIFWLQTTVPDRFWSCGVSPGIYTEIVHMSPTEHMPSLYCDVKSRTSASVKERNEH